MVEQYIENKQYSEALELLSDKQDEHVRYQRLVCLFGLQDYMQAKKEGIVAKASASETYYDVVAIYVTILKELEEFEEAISIMIEELSMPYIPYQYETIFNTAYDELLLAKQDANEGMENQQTIFGVEDMENILTRTDGNEDVLYMAIEQMEGMNIRRFIHVIRPFLEDDSKPAFAKSLLIELMIEQEIDEELVVVKDQQEYMINPSYASMVLDQEVAREVIEWISKGVEDDNPSLYILCEQFLSFYLYSVYPKYIDENKYPALAAAIHYHLATLQYIDIELEDIELLYSCQQEDVLSFIETFQEMI